jgi:hypothetical protein
MGLSVPEALESVIKEFDDFDVPLDEGALWSALMKAAPDPGTVTLELRRGVFAEIAAWRFMRPYGNSEVEPWGIYWGPLTSGILQDGTQVHQPDVAEIDEEILSHWIHRAGTARHPAIRARYSDLAWEIGRYLKRPEKERKNGAKPPLSLDIPVAMAQVAIDSYIHAIERGVAEDEYHSWAYMDRALGLAISLNDKVRIAQAKSALFSYYRKSARENQNFLWARLNDLTEDRERPLELTDAEKQEILTSLENALALRSNMESKELFEPHQARDAADRLARRLQGNAAEVQRVVRRAGAAFEKVAKEASGLLAIAWLEDLIPRYRDAGLEDDAVRVEQLIRGRAAEAHSEMKTITVPMQISREKLEQWANSIMGQTLEQALGLIALQCMVKKDEIEKTLKDMVDNAPLLSMMPFVAIGPDGFKTSTIKSVEDDFPGRSIQEGARRFQVNAVFLSFALARLKEKYGCDLDALVAYLQGAPAFSGIKEALLREGLAAWVADDPVKAIHVLVPQVEAACRNLLIAIGGSVMVLNKKIGGYEVLGMGAVMYHPLFRQEVPEDIRFHFVALYSDQRGMNLRNHLAHGLADIGLLGMGLANWVIHSLLLLAALRVKKKTPDAGSAHGG